MDDLKNQVNGGQGAVVPVASAPASAVSTAPPCAQAVRMARWRTAGAYASAAWDHGGRGRATRTGGVGVWWDMRRLFVLMVLVGCAGPATPAESVGSPDATPTATPVAAGEPMRGPTPPLPTEAKIQQLIAQAALDHPRVQPYLHTEVPANVPLALFAGPGLAKGADKLRAGGQLVKVVGEAEARVILRGREDIGPARVRVRLDVPQEGVTGHVDVQLADNVWRAVDASVVER